MDIFEKVLGDDQDTGAIKSFMQAKQHQDFKGAEAYLHNDIVSSGFLKELEGREKMVAILEGVYPKLVESVRIVAVKKITDINRYMILQAITVQGTNFEFMMCDLLSVSDGKITRVDNCGNMDTLPPDVHTKLLDVMGSGN